jgi:cytochrome o ubiquinol oxidase operon protein cyoD
MNANRYFEDIGAWPPGTGNKGYAIGFIASLALTFAAYACAVLHIFEPLALALILAVLALAQAGVQLACFLHAGKGRGARERLLVLGSFALVILILVAGSVWIMFSLNARMMPDTMQMEQYMQSQQGI